MPTKRMYAERTKVSPMQTLMQIQAELKKAGASQFMLLSDDEDPMEGIMFKRDGITYKMFVPVPDEQRRASLLRALLLIVKAKIVAVDSGVRTFEQEFLSDILLAGNRTYGEQAIPEIRKAIEAGHVPKSLPLRSEN